MLRYFAGLGIEDTAAALDLSAATIKREWNYARAWLLDAMSEEEHEPKRAGQRRTSA
jgi:DNA-directed RNA polymerase specialized sigma24 family protein